MQAGANQNSTSWIQNNITNNAPLLGASSVGLAAIGISSALGLAAGPLSLISLGVMGLTYTILKPTIELFNHMSQGVRDTVVEINKITSTVKKLEKKINKIIKNDDYDEDHIEDIQHLLAKINRFIENDDFEVDNIQDMRRTLASIGATLRRINDDVIPGVQTSIQSVNDHTLPAVNDAVENVAEMAVNVRENTLRDVNAMLARYNMFMGGGAVPVPQQNPPIHQHVPAPEVSSDEDEPRGHQDNGRRGRGASRGRGKSPTSH